MTIPVTSVGRTAPRNVHDILFDSARAQPSAIALIHGDIRLTYGDLAQATGAATSWLAGLGVQPTDRVALILPNVPEFAQVYYAVSALGAVSVPLNPLLKKPEIEHAIRDCGAKLILVWRGIEAEAVAAGELADVAVQVIEPGLAERLPVDSQPRPQGDRARVLTETAVILYTSGTTGSPKGAELTHANIVSNAEAMRSELAMGVDDVVLGCLPLFHVFGQTCALNGALAAGATLSLLTRFDPVAALQTIRRDTVTVFQGVPTMFATMIDAAHSEDPDVLRSVRLCVSGGASLPPSTAQRFLDVFGCEVREGYGLSETSSVVTFNSHYRENRPGSIGRPIPGVEVAVVDDHGNPRSDGGIGELLVRGPNVMKGYHGLPDATREAFSGDWFRTGDLGYADDDGYLFVVDRKKDVVLRGGYNVYPCEVEEALLRHPAVAEVCVVGMTHETLGEEVAAVIVVRHPIAADELLAWIRDRVAAYKYPRHIVLVDALPKGPTGKVLRRELRTTLRSRATVARTAAGGVPSS